MPLFPVSFQDLHFRHRFVDVTDREGRVRQKWIPYGMPLIGEAIHHAVFYLMGPGKDGLVPTGTGALVSRMSNTGWSGSISNTYAVTALHVLRGTTHIRFNMLDRKTRKVFTRDIPTVMEDWTYREDREDLAILDVSGEVEYSHDVAAEHNVILERFFVTKPFIEEYNVGVGEDGFMIGLFSPHPGTERNMPAARFGCLSLLASDHDPVPQPQDATGVTLNRPAHVFEIRSRPGLSGSPVFLYRTPFAGVNWIGEQKTWSFDTHKNIFLRFLGIHVGQFQEDIKLPNGTAAKMPSSMTIIVPAPQISELLDMPKLENERRERVKRHSPKQSSVAQEAEAEESVGVQPDNPTHKEDFTRLLGAAAQSKKQA